MKEKKHSSIYVLTAFSIREDASGKPVLMKDNASIKLRQTQCGVFSSVKRAERAILKIAKARDEEIASGWSDLHYFGFALVEHYCDDAFFNESNVCTFRSFRTYLPNGQLNYFSDTDEACKKKFRGTSMASRFSPGDFAWVLAADHAFPTLVEAESYSREEWRAKMKKGVSGDFTDDSGIDFPYRGGGHDHTFAPLLFPESKELHIPEEAKSEMKAARRNWLNCGV